MIRAAVGRGYGLSVAEAAGRKDFPDCSRCRQPGNEQLREYWGCDWDADSPVWQSTCHRCGGANPECELCKGTDRVAHSRCPSSIVAEGPTLLTVQLDLLMRAYRQYAKRSILPVGGAYLDQSRAFLAAVEVIDGEKAYWELEMHEEQRRKMESERRRAQAQGGRG